MRPLIRNLQDRLLPMLIKTVGTYPGYWLRDVSDRVDALIDKRPGERRKEFIRTYVHDPLLEIRYLHFKILNFLLRLDIRRMQRRQIALKAKNDFE